MKQGTRFYVGLCAGALVATLGACKKGSEYASNDSTAARVDSAAGRTDTSAMAVATPDSVATTGKWADASVLGYATVANRGEIALGKLGERMATNPAVRSFARMMVTDHQQMLAGTKQLGVKVSATPDTTADDARDLMNHTTDDFKDLSSKAKGTDWDRAYIDQQIDGHQKVLSQLQDAAKHSPDATLRSALEQATGKVQAHLTKAQDIKTNVLKN